MTERLSVLIDGWSLIYRPNSPAALQLLTLLACHPERAGAFLALPGEPPEWLAGRSNLQVRHIPDGIRQRMFWEQRSLPGLAKELGARLVHLISATPALFSSIPSLVSPADVDEPLHQTGFFTRLRHALSSGGMAHAAGLLWPADLPSPSADVPVFRIVPAPPFSFIADSPAEAEDVPQLDLPETYILYHGPSSQVALQSLLKAYGWAAGSLGENYPLLLLGLDDPGRERLPGMLAAYGLEGFVHALPVISPFSIPQLYQKCSVLFHPAEIAPWGNPLRNAFACGRPVVAGETALSDALVGPAAYLVALDRPRELGAALITVVVEEELAQHLSAEALQRSVRWQVEAFRQELDGVYQALYRGIG